MKKIMFVTLILLLFITCSGVWAEGNISDDMIADTILDDGVQSSPLNESDYPDSFKTGDGQPEGEYVDASEAYYYLNAFRTEENVWYWNSDDATQSHVNTNDTVWLKPVQRDVELENTAKIRAKEISEYFSHQRPDGSMCFSIFPENLLDYGENIAYGYEGGFEVTEGWKETDMSYEGQGHRRTMLQASFNYVGIAGYKVDGIIYWVQNFGCRYDPEDVDSRFSFENNTQNPCFSIEVPKYASGTFDVYVNGTLISSKSLSNGKADISVCGLAPGKYEVFLSYSGDYNCNPVNRTETVIIPDYENLKDPLTFNHLNTLIQMAEYEVRLENDYAYNPNVDKSFCEGIRISKPLVIDGEGHTIDAKNLARIFKIEAYGVILKNIRLINANADLPLEKRYFDDSAYGPTSYYYFTAPIKNGGAIYAYNYISLINSTFSNNNAFRGGVIYCDANVNAENCQFSENSAGDDGGAIYSWDVYLKNTSFTDNRAVDWGAAVYAQETLEAENSLFKNNYNHEISARKFINNSNTFIDDDEYMKLFANATVPNGIVTLNRNYIASGTVFITASNVIIDGKGYTIDAKHKTSLFNISGDNVIIRNLNVLNGSSVRYGGAIYVSSPTLTVINSKFDNCVAQRGGAIYGNLTEVTLINSTFTNNLADDFAGDTMALGGAVCTGNRSVCVINSTFIKNTGYDGGAIHADFGEISISDSYFEGNSAVYYGGGAVTTACDVDIISSTFKDNSASTYGGAVFCWNESRLNIRNSTFEKNRCDHYGGAISAALWAEITDSIFTGNSATHYAGALCIWGNLSVSNSNFTNNNAQVASSIYDYCFDGCLTITGSNFINNTHMSLGTLFLTTNAFVRNSTFANNRAYDGICGAIDSEQNLTVSDSIFTNNSAVRSQGYSVGGAIASYGENLNVENSVFADSHVIRGGAIANFAKNAHIRNSIFANNSAQKDGGAIFNYDDTFCSVSDSIFENNTAFDGGALCGANAVNCTFTQNLATNLASAMYGVSNTAENCRFFKNVDYVEGPVYGVATTDCTFTGNRLIVTAGFDPYYVYPSYYQGEILYIALYDYRDYSYIENATVTIRAYKNNSPAGEFEYLSGEGWTVNITEGNYTFAFSVENQDYVADPVNVTLTVFKTEIADVQISMENNSFAEPTVAEIISNLDGTISVYLDDYYMEYFDVAANEKLRLTYNYIAVGSHTLKIVMTPANYHFASKTFERNFTVLKKPTSVALDVENTTSTESVMVTVNASAYGNVNVKIGDIEKNVYVSEGIETQIDFGVLKAGTYVVTATFAGDENYASSNASRTIKISDKITQDDIKISKDLSGNLTIALPKDATGSLTLTIAGENYNVDVKDGIANVVLPDLKGVHEYTLTYSGDGNYGGFTITGSLNASSAEETVKLTPDMKVSEFTNGFAQVSLPADATGKLTLTIGDENLSFDVLSATTYVMLPDLKDGVYSYEITYSGDGKYSQVSQSGRVSVVNPVEPVIEASNMNVLYSAGSFFKATVYGIDGKVAANYEVVFKVADKVFKTATADDNGVASFKVTQIPGKYSVEVTALGKTVTKTLNVKHLVTLKSVTVKRSAKKLVLTATLGKINNKYLKNKPVTFKFNGKTYKAKTNSKGVAKVTIKSNVLKKLKVGKKVTYQATYSKDTVKKTVKIKK